MRWTVFALGVSLLSACGPSTPTGADYSTHCISVLVRKAEVDRVWRGSEVALIDPEIIAAGPPAIVRCAAKLRTGEFVTFEITARCRNGLEEHCSAPRT